MVSLEASLRVAKELDLHEPIARLNIFRTLFHRPKTAKAISDLLLSLLFDSALDHRRRELIIMRIGWTTGSEYEWTQHWPLAQQMFGCTAEEVLAVRAWRPAECFDAVDRAVLAATDELLDTGDLSDETWRACLAGLGRDAAIDMVAAIGTWSLISKLARGLRVPLEDGVVGWPPDGKVPPSASGKRDETAT
ncbi:MAG: carboxymuconolactone decarboxylase family protein [Deltaproteobacteria bacterium]|nr:carboxymuconolactone decarboxylase family protein [Deltaproteobacteria bacterium]